MVERSTEEMKRSSKWHQKVLADLEYRKEVEDLEFLGQVIRKAFQRSQALIETPIKLLKRR